MSISDPILCIESDPPYHCSLVPNSAGSIIAGNETGFIANSAGSISLAYESGCFAELYLRCYAGSSTFFGIALGRMRGDGL